MTAWLANFFSDEDGRARLVYGLRNRCWMMQYRYGAQDRGSVTRNFRQNARVVAGDQLVARLDGQVYAIGQICEPRLGTDQWDTVQRSTAAGNHLFAAGSVRYHDAPAFYEKLTDNGFDGAWGQRIDVEAWIYVGEGIASPWPPPAGAPFYALHEIPLEQVGPITNALRQTAGMQEIAKHDGEEVLRTSRQIILSGPPGTSKTFIARSIAAALLGFECFDPNFEERQFHLRMPNQDDAGWWDIVQFHPAYNYEDFVRGIATKTIDKMISYDAEDRIFARMCRAAAQAREGLDDDEAGPPFVLIIDEINRANLPAVFGELLYALEYRGKPVATSYAIEENNTLAVPPNLYIIGTMNTSDRSIGQLDYAVRRRFAFIDCPPDQQTIRYEGDSALQEAARAAFKAVAQLFEKPHLSPDFRAEDVQVGHTYFMNCRDRDQLRLRIRHQVVPLLREYLADGVLVAQAEIEGRTTEHLIDALSRDHG